MKIEPFCEGFCVHWEKPAGESLQGWYKTKEEAKKVVDEIIIACYLAKKECYCGYHENP